MRHTCPHCAQDTLSGRSVRWSSRGAPCACPRCGGLSHVLASTASGISAFTVLFGVAATIVAVALQSAVLAVVCAPLVLWANVMMWRRVELWPISPQAARQNARASLWLTLVAVLLAFLR